MKKRKALIISCFEIWYRDRLALIRDCFHDFGYESRIVVSDFDHIRKCQIEDEKKDDCQYVHVNGYKKNVSIERMVSHLTFGKKVGRLLKEYKPDLVYLLVPPNNTALYCNIYKRTNERTKLIIDIIDLWPESMPFGIIKKTFAAIFWAYMRNKGIEGADYVFTECILYKKRLSKILESKKVTSLYLYKNKIPLKQEFVKKLLNEYVFIYKDQEIALAYVGSINHIIDLDSICNIIQSFVENGFRTKIHIIGNGNKRDEFLNRIYRTRAIVYYHGEVYDEIQKTKILAPCDMALNLMKSDVSVGLTVKSIDYLSMGLPIINNIKGDTFHLVKKYGIGINYMGNSDAIVDWIRQVDLLDVRHNSLECYNKFFTEESFRNRFKKAIKFII